LFIGLLICISSNYYKYKEEGHSLLVKEVASQEAHMKVLSDSILDPWEEKRAAEKELIDSIVSGKLAA
jgi:hypothetical protein